MKKWIIGVAVLAITTLQAEAQQSKRQQPNPEERAKQTTDKMAAELSLSESQKAQILELNLDQAKKRQAEMERMAAERKEKMEAMKAHQEKINSILTDEQRAKWEEMKLEQREKRRPGGEIHNRKDFPRRKDRS